MAINKTINKRTKTHGAMKNCIEYVLKEQKIEDGLVYVTGPYMPEMIDADKVYRAFLEEKKLWNKDSGRMYNHNIISFHKDERITPREALEFGKEFAEKWFPRHQTLITVHQDKEHVHIHFVTNTVSFVDGRKLHNTKADLEKMKKLTNDMCKERKLSVAEKGKHFDGSLIEPFEIRAWSKDKYNLVCNEQKKSYVVDCAIAISGVIEECYSREQFIEKMRNRGWHVKWNDARKHITFENEEGKKVRDTNLSKTFQMNVTKEVLNGEFERQNKRRLERERAERNREEELRKYYAEVESAICGAGSFGETVAGITDSKAGERQVITRENNESRDDTRTLIRNIKSAISDYRIENNTVRNTEIESIINAEQRRFEKGGRTQTEERTDGTGKKTKRRSGPSL